MTERVRPREEIGDEVPRTATGFLTPLRLDTIYFPPNHPDGMVHKTRAETGAAEALEPKWGGLAACVHTQ